MANTSRPNGFRPYGEALRETPYTASAAIYPGDLVKLTDAGKVAVAAAGDACLGVAASYASGDDQEVIVWDDPDQRFIGQADAGTTLAQTSVGLNFNFVAASPSTAYRRSRQVVDSDTGATTAALPLQLIGYSREENREIGELADCVVVINEHQLAKGAGQVGV